MNAYPFSVFKRADRPCYLVSFKDDNRKYLPPRSTKKTCEKEAMKVAFEWLRYGIPQKKNTLRISDLSVKTMVCNISSGDEAALLAAVTGIRIGEILALQVQDLGTDCLYVYSSWNRINKLKLPKNIKKRTVEISFLDLMIGLIEQVKQNPWGIMPDNFVFWTEFNKDYFEGGMHTTLFCVLKIYGIILHKVVLFFWQKKTSFPNSSSKKTNT